MVVCWTFQNVNKKWPSRLQAEFGRKEITALNLAYLPTPPILNIHTKYSRRRVQACEFRISQIKYVCRKTYHLCNTSTLACRRFLTSLCAVAFCLGVMSGSSHRVWSKGSPPWRSLGRGRHWNLAAEPYPSRSTVVAISLRALLVGSVRGRSFSHFGSDLTVGYPRSNLESVLILYAALQPFPTIEKCKNRGS